MSASRKRSPTADSRGDAAAGGGAGGPHGPCSHRGPCCAVQCCAGCRSRPQKPSRPGLAGGLARAHLSAETAASSPNSASMSISSFWREGLLPVERRLGVLAGLFAAAATAMLVCNGCRQAGVPGCRCQPIVGATERHFAAPARLLNGCMLWMSNAAGSLLTTSCRSFARQNSTPRTWRIGIYYFRRPPLQTN